MIFRDIEQEMYLVLKINKVHVWVLGVITVPII